MRKAWAVLVVATAIFAAGPGWAADSATLTVQALVVPTCMFEAPKTATLDFGSLTPGGGNVTQSAMARFWCTAGVSTLNFAVGNGLNYSGTSRGMKHATFADVIPYSIDSVTPDGNPNAGPASPRTVTIQGTVQAAAYAAVTAGAYSDTVLVSINP